VCYNPYGSVVSGADGSVFRNYTYTCLVTIGQAINNTNTGGLTQVCTGSLPSACASVLCFCNCVQHAVARHSGHVGLPFAHRDLPPRATAGARRVCVGVCVGWVGGGGGLEV
jgi:hypothetical protein